MSFLLEKAIGEDEGNDFGYLSKKIDRGSIVQHII
jgi:hypothetical protein